jgi:hypothetical protein
MTVVRRAVVALVVSSTLTGGAFVAAAAPISSCALGGPTPGVRALRLDLPAGTDGMSLRVRPPSQVGRRLVEGVFLLSARAHRLIAFDIAVDGASSDRTVVRAGGTSVVNTRQTGPAAPFGRHAGAVVPDLEPGSYYLVGFGSGSATQWGAELEVNAPHTCMVVGGGGVFTRDASRSTSPTAADATGAAVVSAAPLSLRTSQPLVVGVMQATHELAGHARLDYRTPTTHGTVTDSIAPFVSTAGRYRWSATATAAFPVLAVAGAVVNLRARQPR